LTDPILYLIFALFSGLLGTAFSVLIRMELSGPGVQYIAGAPSNFCFKSGDLDSKSYDQYSLNQLTYPTTKEVGEWSMSVKPLLTQTEHEVENGKVDASHATKSPTIAGYSVPVGISSVKALY